MLGADALARRNKHSSHNFISVPAFPVTSELENVSLID
jgi:hypothetical protein